MKKLFFILASTFFFVGYGCKSDTEKGLKGAIIDIRKAKLLAAGESIESISIDSISYKSEKLKTFYQHKIDYAQRYMTEMLPLQKEVFNGALPSDSGAFKDSTDNANIIAKYTSLLNQVDTISEVYHVKYIISFRTDKQNKKESGRVDIDKATLKEVTE